MCYCVYGLGGYIVLYGCVYCERGEEEGERDSLLYVHAYHAFRLCVTVCTEQAGLLSCVVV